MKMNIYFIFHKTTLIPEAFLVFNNSKSTAQIGTYVTYNKRAACVFNSAVY